MALSTREMYLVLKVRDEGSRMLRAFGNEFSSLNARSMQAAQKQLVAGAALATIGVAIAAAGIAGLGFFNEATNASMEYTQAASLTLTQVDKLGVGLQQVKDIGRRVANEVPIAFESIQKGLYDIFSSMDVTIPQAETLLRELSKAAVAGQVEVSVAARSVIGILNAYKLPATDVNKVNDVMFQLVRKGIGTYEQFTSTIGRSIPSAVKAGQSYQSVAGMLAFLTRNNMSAQMSASAVARAMDSITKTKAQIKLKEMGIAVADAHGRFRPMVDIVTEMREKLSKLTPVARAAKLDDIFKGSGNNIQAMRFFNLATGKSGPLLNEMTGYMNKAGGASAAAYKIMANTPQAKIDLLNNRYKVMKTVVGDQLVPAKLKLIEALSSLLGWWNRLGPTVQKGIIIFLAVSSVLLVIAGIVVTVVGGIIAIGAAITMAGPVMMAAIAGVLVTIGWVIAAIIAIGVAAFFIIKYWSQIKAFTIKIWTATLNWLSGAWDATKAKGIAIFNAVMSFFSSTWDAIKSDTLAVWNGVKSWLSTTWDSIKNKVMSVFNGIKNWLSSTWDTIKGGVVGAWNTISGNFMTGFNAIVGFVSAGVNRITAPWRWAWGLFSGILKAAWGLIVAIVNLGIAAVTFVIAWEMRGLYNIWNTIWGWISTAATTAWNTIYNFVAPKVIALKDWIVNAWNTVKDGTIATWNLIVNNIKAVWNAIYGYVAPKVTAVRNWLSATWSAIKADVSGAWSAVYNYISGHISSAYDVVVGKVNAIKAWIAAVWSAIKTVTSNDWQALVSIVSSKIDAVVSWVTGIRNRILSALGNVRDMLYNAGKSIIEGLARGITDAIGAVTGAVTKVTGWIKAHMPGSPVKEGPLRVLNNGYAGKQIVKMIAAGMNDIGPITRAMNTLGSAIAEPMFATAGVSANANLGSSSGYGGGNYGGSGQTITMKNYITTQEINPEKHAADLGWAFASKVRP